MIISLKIFYVLLGILLGYVVFAPSGRAMATAIITAPAKMIRALLAEDSVLMTFVYDKKRRAARRLRRWVRTCASWLLRQLGAGPLSNPGPTRWSVGIQVGEPIGVRDRGFPPGVAEQIADLVNAPPPRLNRLQMTHHGECWHASPHCIALQAPGGVLRDSYSRRPCRICSLGYWDVADYEV